MQHTTRSRSTLAFAFAALAGPGLLAQQTGVLNNDDVNDGFESTMSIQESGTPGCNVYYYSTLPSTAPWGQFGDDSGSLPYYYSLPGTMDANGNAQFHMNIDASLGDCPNTAMVTHSFQVYVDEQLCTSCAVDESGLTVVFPGVWTPFGGGGWSTPPIITGTLAITHQVGDSWYIPNGVRKFTVRIIANNVPVGDIRFNAIMVGNNLTGVIGHFTAPQTPAYILRDPPGDMSYSQLVSSVEYCYGETFSTSDALGISSFAKVKVGTEVEVFGAELSYGVTAGVSASREETNAAAKEYRTCLTSTSTYTMAMDGAPTSDLFIGSGVDYNYGVARIIERPNCDFVFIHNDLIIAPTGGVNGFAYTEDDILNTVIPNAQSLVNSLTPGTIPYKQAVNQVEAWQNALAMNNALKQEALNGAANSQNFSGGGSTTTLDETITTSASAFMDMQVVLEGGLQAEFSANVGGSGIEAGGEITVRHAVGVGQSQSNTTTTTHTVSFADSDASDHFEVAIYKDKAYGAPVFGALDNNSQSSCPYEGGYQLDQPVLWVGAMGTSTFSVSNVPNGESAIFPIYACNNSSQPRTYSLSLNAQTNPLGAIISGFNGLTSSSAVQLTVPAGGCNAVGYLYLDQPAPSVLDFDAIEVILSSACAEPDDISTAVTISAHFLEPTGIEEAANVVLNAYPSPANDVLRVTLQRAGSHTVRVLDLTGRTQRVLRVSGPTVEVPVDDLANGEYLLQVENEAQRGTARFIVAHP